MRSSNPALLTYLLSVLLTYLLPCSLITYRGDDKSLAQPTSPCILFDGENISFDAGLVIYI